MLAVLAVAAATVRRRFRTGRVRSDVLSGSRNEKGRRQRWNLRSPVPQRGQGADSRRKSTLTYYGSTITPLDGQE